MSSSVLSRWVELAPVVECKGCGRPVDVSSLKAFRRFYCVECGQVHRTGGRQSRFRFTPLHARRQRNIARFLAVLLVLLPPGLLGWQADTHPAWDPVRHPAGLAGLALGAVCAWLFLAVRPRSNDPQLWGGVLLILAATERLYLSAVGAWWVGAPFELGKWDWTVSSLVLLGNGCVMLVFLPLARRFWPSL